jgi:hypothetical protein
MNLTWKSLLIVVSGLLLAEAGLAVNYSAVLYEQNSNREKKLYTLQVEDLTPDGLENQATYKDLEGNVVVQDKATLKSGSELLKYEIDHKQLGQKGMIEIKDGKAYFTKVTADGKSSTKEEKLGKTFVISATFQKFVRDNWEAISGGKTVDFRYGVWDRQETVGFEVFKTGEEKVGEQQALVLKMKPSSFLIAALVKPIIFKFAADGSKLFELNGRVAPKRKDGSSWKDLDAEAVYSYAEAAPAPSTTTTTEAEPSTTTTVPAKKGKKKK